VALTTLFYGLTMSTVSRLLLEKDGGNGNSAKLKVKVEVQEEI